MKHHCPYCGTEVKDTVLAPKVARLETIGYDKERRLTKVRCGSFKPCHDPCAVWYAAHLRKKNELAGTITRGGFT